MIKRTLCFTNPAYLSLRNEQLVIKLPAEGQEPERQTAVPIEDIGIIVLDNPQISITSSVFSKILENSGAIITCDATHHPTGLHLPLDGNTLQSERFHHQIEASLPLRKQLWQQTVAQKIRNQAAALSLRRGAETGALTAWASKIRSGDPDNLEGRAAAFYWRNMYGDISDFSRDRDGVPPNNLLNYGYAILRAMTARALVISGLLPTLGIHHHNRYNAYCLADDIMEPYRPYVDMLVDEIWHTTAVGIEITREIKAKLLTLPTADVIIGGERSPLMVALSQTTASLYKCYAGEQRTISYPTITV